VNGHNQSVNLTAGIATLATQACLTLQQGSVALTLKSN